MRLTFDDPATLELARRVQALSRDLDLIRQLKAPTILDYSDAPLLENWTIGQRAELAIVGDVSRHPGRPDGRIVTSGLYFMDPRAGYARTLSRWYRLGSPAKS